jgi:hypothetical protein
MRTRVRWTLTTEAGDVVPYASVRVYNVDGQSLYSGPIFRGTASNQRYSNPFNVAPVRLEFFLDKQVRVRLGLRSVPDGPEIITPVIDAIADADEIVYAIDELTIPANENLLVLRANTSSAAYWYRPGIGDHDHAGLGDNSTELGHFSFGFSQVSGYPGVTILGGHDEHVDPDDVLSYTWGTLTAQYPTWGALDSLPWGTFDQVARALLTAPSGFDHTTAVGRSSLAAGSGTTAVGTESRAAELDEAAGATALGYSANAMGESLAVGHLTSTISPAAVVLGHSSTAFSGGTTAGERSVAPVEGVALGHLANGDASAPIGSVLCGSQAVTSTREGPCVVLGPGQEGALRPDATGIEGVALLVQGFLSVLALGDLQVYGDAALGRVGFFGRAPVDQAYVGNDEVASGIEALDSLIYALRDLGLIRSRKDAVARYSPETLRQAHLVGDQIREWPDVDRAKPRLVTALNTEPTLTATDPVSFDASQVPWEFALVEKPLPPTKHVVVVARHHSVPPRPLEGLAGMYTQRFRDHLIGDAVQPLSRENNGWATDGLSSFTVDGQLGNARSTPDAQKHVYRATHQDVWENDSLVLGAAGGQYSTGWWGGISEAAALDKSWQEKDVVSYTTGLTFLHNARGAADWLMPNAVRFLRQQQGDQLSLSIQLGRDYPTTADRKLIQGTVSGFTGVDLKSVPLLRIGNSEIAMAYAFAGSIAGYWSYLTNPQNYWVELYSFATEFTGTWAPSALVGRFALNAAGTWSTGPQRVPRGNKRWRLVLRSNLSQVTSDEWVPGAYYDTAVKIYAVNDAGVRTLEATVPLQGDGTWMGVTTHGGRIVAELCRRSTGAVFATTDRHLPMDFVARSADADYATAHVRASIRTAALTVLAYVGAGQQYWSHAGEILRALRRLQQPSGVIYTAYDASVAPPTPFNSTVLALDLAWVGIAALAFGDAVQDHTRFEQLVLGIAVYLRTQQDPETGSIVDEPGGDYGTETNAVCWLFFRDLARVRGWEDITGDIAKTLDNNHWVPELRRFTRSLGTTDRDTGADIWGGLYQLATEQRDRAKLSLRSLAYAKVVGASVTDGYYGGATALTGYLPTDTAGAHILDQERTWAALLFKSRYGDPVGDDVVAQRNWTNVTPVTTGGQFLSFTNSVGARIARPSTVVAAQALLAAQRVALFWPAPIPGPRVVATQLTVVKLAAGGYQFTYEWAPEDERQPAFFEAVAQRSFDNGTTWVAMPSRSRSGQISVVRRTPDSVWPWLYGASWIESGPLTNSTVTRVNIRMRANAFGPWASTEGRYPNGQILPTPVVIGPP